MNIEKLLTIIRHYIKESKNFIKASNSLPGSGKYYIASLLLILLFVYITFPYEQIIIKKIHTNEGKSFTSASFTGLNIGIIGKTFFDKFNISFPDSTDFSAEKGVFDLSTNPYTLFIKKRINTDLKIESIKYSGREVELNGKLSGNIDIIINDRSGIPENGSLSIQLTQSILQPGIITIPTPMDQLKLKLDPIIIQSLVIEIDIINKACRIKKFNLASDNLICTVSGSINLEPSFKNSRLDLIITIDPSSKVLESISPFLKKKSVEISIKGSIARPEYSRQQSGSEKNEN